MLKLGAAFMAAANANNLSRREQFTETAEMFKIIIHKNQTKPLAEDAMKTYNQTLKYAKQFEEEGRHYQLTKDVNELIDTSEWTRLQTHAEYVRNFDYTKNYNSQSQYYELKLKQSLQRLDVQYDKMEGARYELQQSTEMKSYGTYPKTKVYYDVDDEKWVKYNMEYYKYRQMQLEVMQSEIMKELRDSAKDVVATPQWKKIEVDWKMLTESAMHQTMVNDQVKLVAHLMECLHFEGKDDEWMNPKYSPVVHDTLYVLFIYFRAIGNGDLKPMLDFVIDGKIEPEFEDHLKPEFGAPPKEKLIDPNAPKKKDDADADTDALFLF